MDIVEQIRDSLAAEWLASIYADKIRTQRTRSVRIDVPARENQAEIQYTLLGIELRVGRRRFPCPDLSAARYMRVFARLGCREFAIPYDITRISSAADDLETSWQRALLLLDDASKNRPSRGVSQLRSKLIRTIRHEIDAIGAGDAMPQFDRPTKQRQT
jgi:hypothetical protein